jgi:hypothetical protein
MTEQPKTEFERQQADAPGIGVKPDGSPDLVTENEARRPLGLIEKAKKSGKLEDWHVAGIPLKVRPNPPVRQ